MGGVGKMSEAVHVTGRERGWGWRGVLGGRMSGLGEWVGWENEWGRLHMLQGGGKEGRGMYRGVSREKRWVGEWVGWENRWGGKMSREGCACCRERERGG